MCYKSEWLVCVGLTCVCHTLYYYMVLLLVWIQWWHYSSSHLYYFFSFEIARTDWEQPYKRDDGEMKQRWFTHVPHSYDVESSEKIWTKNKMKKIHKHSKYSFYIRMYSCLQIEAASSLSFMGIHIASMQHFQCKSVSQFDSTALSCIQLYYDVWSLMPLLQTATSQYAYIDTYMYISWAK